MTIRSVVLREVANRQTSAGWNMTFLAQV